MGKRGFFSTSRESFGRGPLDDNLSKLAEKWGFHSGGGNFSIYVNQLVEGNFLKRFSKNGRAYIRITRKGEIAICLGTCRSSHSFHIDSISDTSGRSDSVIDGSCNPPPRLYLGDKPHPLIFSLFGIYTVNRMEKFLLRLS